MRITMMAAQPFPVQLLTNEFNKYGGDNLSDKKIPEDCGRIPHVQ
jgi:hypothetical protein